MSKYTNDEIYTKYLLTNKDFMKHWVNTLHDNYNWDIVDAVRFVFQEVPLTELNNQRISEFFQAVGVDDYNASQNNNFDIIHNDCQIIRLTDAERFSDDTVRVTISLFDLGYLFSKRFVRIFPYPDDKQNLDKKLFDVLKDRVAHAKTVRRGVEKISQSKEIPVYLECCSNSAGIVYDDNEKVLMISKPDSIVVINDAIQAEIIQEAYQNYKIRILLLKNKISLTIKFI